MNVEKPCPDCGGKLLIRTNSNTGEDFIGCSKYPDCKHTEPLPLYLKLRAMGAEPLPGFE